MSDTAALVTEHNHRQAEHPVSPQFLDRWSPRAFTPETISRETLATLFEAAKWAPSSYNSQPWRFVYALRDTPSWTPFLEALVPFNQGWAKSAAALVYVLSKASFVPPGASAPTNSASASFDAGAAWASFALQASALGWATHGMIGFDAEAVKRAVKASDEYRVEAAIAVGKQGDKSLLPEQMAAREAPSPRRAFAESFFEGEIK